MFHGKMFIISNLTIWKLVSGVAFTNSLHLWWILKQLMIKVSLPEQFHHKHMGMFRGGLLDFVMKLLQWHQVCMMGGDELHRPPLVALTWMRGTGSTLLMSEVYSIPGNVQLHHAALTNSGSNLQGHTFTSGRMTKHAGKKYKYNLENCNLI